MLKKKGATNAVVRLESCAICIHPWPRVKSQAFLSIAWPLHAPSSGDSIPSFFLSMQRCSVSRENVAVFTEAVVCTCPSTTAVASPWRIRYNKQYGRLRAKAKTPHSLLFRSRNTRSCHEQVAQTCRTQGTAGKCAQRLSPSTLKRSVVSCSAGCTSRKTNGPPCQSDKQRARAPPQKTHSRSARTRTS